MLWRLLKSGLRPARSAERLVQRALSLRREGRAREAEAVLRTAVLQHPRAAAAATNLAVMLLEQGRVPEAVPLLERAIDLDAGCAPARFNYAHVLRASGRLADAIPHYEAAVAADASFAPAHEALMFALLEACEWERAERLATELRDRTSHDEPEGWLPFVSPLTAMYLGLDPERCKAAAAFHAPPAAPHAVFEREPRPAGARLRIAYLSGDFRDHVMGHLMGGAFSLHDRSRFEVHAYSHGIDDGSADRRRIAESVERFVDVSAMRDDEAAAAIADARIDVLIELMGHTTGNRLGILARRCAPVQAHFLGYPGTIGAPYVDYYIGDAIASPPELQAQFSERIVRVPDCYQLNDGAAAFALQPRRRAEFGIPADAFVFCNFGSPTRLDRRSFALWMRILDATSGSVLWLIRTSAAAAVNLKRAAAQRGIDPERLFFGEPLPKHAHLARAACADLGLDTLDWYNGHSTTADLLWAGVPVLTSPGKTFATRVATSLVHNAGLPELAARDDADYCARAVALARDRAAYDGIRARLHAARQTAPLFDTARLVRGLEQAYETMYADRVSGAAIRLGS
jgi:protein O-GlcNAc transferase